MHPGGGGGPPPGPGPPFNGYGLFSWPHVDIAHLLAQQQQLQQQQAVLFQPPPPPPQAQNAPVDVSHTRALLQQLIAAQQAEQRRIPAPPVSQAPAYAANINILTPAQYQQLLRLNTAAAAVDPNPHVNGISLAQLKFPEGMLSSSALHDMGQRRAMASAFQIPDSRPQPSPLIGNHHAHYAIPGPSNAFSIPSSMQHLNSSMSSLSSTATALSAGGGVSSNGGQMQAPRDPRNKNNKRAACEMEDKRRRASFTAGAFRPHLSDEGAFSLPSSSFLAEAGAELLRASASTSASTFLTPFPSSEIGLGEEPVAGPSRTVETVEITDDDDDEVQIIEESKGEGGEREEREGDKAFDLAEFRRRPAPILQDSFPRPATPPGYGALPTKEYLPTHFFSGTVLQCANGTRKTIEELDTDDFIMASLLAQELRLNTSVVASIDRNKVVYRIEFIVGTDRSGESTMECRPEHPFYVIGKGWASCEPPRTAEIYGLQCEQLMINDTVAALTTHHFATKATTAIVEQGLGIRECARAAENELNAIKRFNEAAKEAKKEIEEERDRFLSRYYAACEEDGRKSAPPPEDNDMDFLEDVPTLDELKRSSSLMDISIRNFP